MVALLVWRWSWFTDHGFKSWPGTIAYWPWASYLHLCASVTKQYNSGPAKEQLLSVAMRHRLGGISTYGLMVEGRLMTTHAYARAKGYGTIYLYLSYVVDCHYSCVWICHCNTQCVGCEPCCISSIEHLALRSSLFCEQNAWTWWLCAYSSIFLYFVCVNQSDSDGVNFWNPLTQHCVSRNTRQKMTLLL